MMTREQAAAQGMTLYTCHKQVAGKPMSLGDYNLYRGWVIPDNEDPAAEGFLVEYLDGGKPNHPDHAGYISWSPKLAFDSGYTETFARVQTHGYLPVENTGREPMHSAFEGLKVGQIGFVRKAYADMTQPELAYIEDMKASKTKLLSFPKDRAEAFHLAYAKLKAAQAC